MQLSTVNRNLGQIAAFLGFIQGLAWAAMSLAAIILYNMSPLIEEFETYTQYLGLILYNQFIKSNDSTSYFIIRPSDFSIFMWIYFIISVGWIATSIDQFTAIHYNKKRQKKIMSLWGAVTLIISLIDLVFACLLARDYSTCVDIDSTLVLNCYLSTGIAMTLAARGFTLWVLNIVVAFIMLHVTKRDSKNEDTLTGWIMDHRIPRLAIPKSNKGGSARRQPSPEFLRNDVALPSFLYQEGSYGKDDSLKSFEEKFERFEKSDQQNRQPSFLSRGDRFSY